MKTIRDRYKQKEDQDISEAMKRLEDLKRSIRRLIYSSYFFYKEPLYKEPTARMLKELNNL